MRKQARKKMVAKRVFTLSFGVPLIVRPQYYEDKTRNPKFESETMSFVVTKKT
jgi:hypothetical protein